ncbi:MAG TPA: hypothetical protein VJ001_07080 [Rhodocyclaceae bacterium]|nr:hypothetical protein [Rhodocyclaceae bacterium]
MNPPPMHSCTYKLKRMLWVPPLIVTFFGSMAYFFFQKAMFSYQGMVVFSVVQIPPYMAKYIYWFFFAFSAGVVAFGIVLFITSLQGVRVVMIHANSITVPKYSLTGVKYVEVPFGSIQKADIHKAGNGDFLNVQHTAGKFSLAAVTFQSNAEFDEILTILASRKLAITSPQRLDAKIAQSKKDKTHMFSHIISNAIGTREGQIFLFASLLYFSVGTLAKFAPSVIPISSFVSWAFQFMPVILALFYIKLGGFSKTFESSLFTIAMMLVVAAFPILMKVYPLIAR